VGSGATISGDVVASKAVAVSQGAKISGKVIQSSTTTVPYPIQWSTTNPGDSQGPILLAGNASSAPSPGVYDAITVREGSTLYLRSGRYFLSGLEIAADAHLVLDSRHGPVFVYLSSGFTFLGHEQGADAGLPELFVGYVGVNDAVVKAPFTGVLLAPEADILVGGAVGAVHHAAFYGKNVHVDAGQTIKPAVFDWFAIPDFPRPSLRAIGPSSPQPP
jgi:hypothetical protein